jgi:hypothetical protein
MSSVSGASFVRGAARFARPPGPSRPTVGGLRAGVPTRTEPSVPRTRQAVQRARTSPKSPLISARHQAQCPISESVVRDLPSFLVYGHAQAYGPERSRYVIGIEASNRALRHRGPRPQPRRHPTNLRAHLNRQRGLSLSSPLGVLDADSRELWDKLRRAIAPRARCASWATRAFRCAPSPCPYWISHPCPTTLASASCASLNRVRWW